MAIDVEQLQVQLAGCGVAALGGTTDPVIAKRGDYGWSPAYQDVLDLRRKYDQLLARCAEMEKLVYMPGQWRCPKCNFQLTQSNLNALDGTVTARDTPGDHCPNCNSPLWRVTYREAWKDMMDISDKVFIDVRRKDNALRDIIIASAGKYQTINQLARDGLRDAAAPQPPKGNGDG